MKNYNYKKRIISKKNCVSVIGLGYVGLPLSLLISNRNNIAIIESVIRKILKERNDVSSIYFRLAEQDERGLKINIAVELKTNNHDSIIEMIDVGGPSLLRAAGKNFKYVTAITNIEDYKKLIVNLEFNKGVTDINFRKKMAFKVFKQTSLYDKIISNWLNEKKK